MLRFYSTSHSYYIYIIKLYLDNITLNIWFEQINKYDTKGMAWKWQMSKTNSQYAIELNLVQMLKGVANPCRKLMIFWMTIKA